MSKNDAKRSRSRTKTSFAAGSRSSGLSNFNSTSADVRAMPLKSITESLEKELNQDFFSSTNIIIPKKAIKKLFNKHFAQQS